MAESGTGRSAFVPVVLTGLLAAALTSIASAKPWFTAAVDHRLVPGVPDAESRADMPLSLALSLLVLAGWGALLVSRGRVRRVFATVAVAAALGVLGCVVAAPFTLPDDIRSRMLAGSEDVTISATGWFVAAAAGGVVAAAALVVAWIRLPSWPAMSSRYDAPTAASAATAEAATPTDLWKALDEGRDPTARPARNEDPNTSGGPASP